MYDKYSLSNGASTYSVGEAFCQTEQRDRVYKMRQSLSTQQRERKKQEYSVVGVDFFCTSLCNRHKPQNTAVKVVT